ncbi:MAG: SAM-dependent methyltransferase [Myxococcales bacterium 68-20]|nr:MAG: SAM-dependent methyltransferase [Myxococcales bacterium 68-20]
MSSTFWDERFRGDEYAYGREPNDFLRAEAHRIPAGPVLCLAEGEGRNAVFLARLGHEVTAIDFSLEGLRKTERLAREHGVAVTTVHADLGAYEPETEAFSGIVAIFAHLPPAVRKRVHEWVPRALRAGGVFLLEAYTPEQLALGTGGPKDPAMLMKLAELEDELAPLTIELGHEGRREIHEGALHSGPSETVQLLAIRSSSSI